MASLRAAAAQDERGCACSAGICEGAFAPPLNPLQTLEGNRGRTGDGHDSAGDEVGQRGGEAKKGHREILVAKWCPNLFAGLPAALLPE